MVVDEKNYKDFVKAKTGMVPLYRSYAKKLETERKAVKKHTLSLIKNLKQR